MITHLLLGHSENASSFRAELKENHLPDSMHISLFVGHTHECICCRRWQQACSFFRSCQGTYLWLHFFDDISYVFAGVHAHMSGAHDIKALFAAEGMFGICACEYCA